MYTYTPNYRVAFWIAVSSTAIEIPSGFIFGLGVNSGELAFRMLGAGLCLMGICITVYLTVVLVNVLRRFDSFTAADNWLWTGMFFTAMMGATNGVYAMIPTPALELAVQFIGVATVGITCVVGIGLFFVLDRAPDNALMGLVQPFRWIGLIISIATFSIIGIPLAMILEPILTVVMALIFYRAAYAPTPEWTAVENV